MLRLISSLIVACLFATSAYAENFTVKMYSAHPTDPTKSNVFDPPYLEIEPGDSVTFVPADPSHNTASKKGMIPDGAEPWNSATDQVYTVTFTVPGVYGYVCVPHYEMGMVGMVVVGEAESNLNVAMKVRHPGQAKSAFRDLFELLGAQ